ncbi:MAG: twin-arginine translocation signal domain-containing protein [Bacteroidales bacterium]|nr:twin-arginine translocation signal domain-containing protein [Bacteroidales bacterium]
MERRSFLKKSAAVAGTAFAAGNLSASPVPPPEKDLFRP